MEEHMKKLIGLSFALVVAVAVLAFLKVNAGAVNTGFPDTEPLSQDAIAEIESSNDLVYLTEEPDKSVIDCFDVNKDGLIVFGHEIGLGSKYLITVYTSGGEFLYGYRFDDGGQQINVEWDGNDINVYHVRSDVLVSIDDKGETVGYLKVSDTQDNINYSNYLSSEKRTVGDREYEIKSIGPFFLFVSPSKLIVTEPDGISRTIYDASGVSVAKQIVIILSVIALLFIVIGAIRVNNGNSRIIPLTTGHNCGTIIS